MQNFRTLPDARITVVDQHARVIFTSGKTGFTALQALDQDDLLRASPQAVNGVYRYQRRLETDSIEAPRLAAVAVGADRMEGGPSSSRREHQLQATG